ncbi:MAG: acyltransferase [Armatimonadota bacterium]
MKSIRHPQTSTAIHPLSDVEEGVALGRGVTIARYAHVAGGTVIGEGSAIAQCVDIEAGAVIGQRVKIDAGSCIAAGAVIGDETHLGEYVMLVPILDGRANSLPATAPPATIGRGVRVGEKSTIGPGVTVGDGAVITPGSVVSEDVPPYAVAAGNPAGIIGTVCHCAEAPVPAVSACPSCGGFRNITAALDSLLAAACAASR